MEIRNLATTDVTTIVDCLTKSFADYFVPMSTDLDYWRTRFRIARIDFMHSYGWFDHDILAGFILIGIDNHEGYLTAYNGGTGVIPEYRGKKVVDKLYEFAIPELKSLGVERCTLEVIEQNARAIKVYERIRFKLTKKLHCYKSVLQNGKQQTQLKEITLSEIDTPEIQQNQYPCWDHTIAALKCAGGIYTAYALQNTSGDYTGFLVINRENGYIPQIGLFPEKTEKDYWNELIENLKSICSIVKINNVDSRRTGLIATLEQHGFENFINQYQMELFI